MAEGRHGFAECFSKPKDLPVDDAVAEIVNGQTSRDADAALRGPRSGLLKKPDRLQRSLFQRSKHDKLAPKRAIDDCYNC